ncbi:ATP-binding protein [Streptomyces sp. NPDC046866]|uniref:ATP-binding protein n=1 Tax=Streptomyces sp. NPDC046866 TaxID=3154921 RepID=UPI003456A91C
MNLESRELLRFGVQLSSTPRGARLARLLTVEQLRGWGLPLEAGAQVVAELAVNAVAHGRVAGRDFRLELAVRGDTLRVEVADTRVDRLPVEGGEGRGLRIVAAYADRWGVTLGPPPRKTVWAELSVWGRC